MSDACCGPRGDAEPDADLLVTVLDGVSYPGQLVSQLGLTRSNVSNHLSCLRGCGLVVATYEGGQVRYELADVHLAQALSMTALSRPGVFK